MHIHFKEICAILSLSGFCMAWPGLSKMCFVPVLLLRHLVYNLLCINYVPRVFASCPLRLYLRPY